jgi:hypothetical protein
VRFYRAEDAEPKQWRCGYRIWRYALQETVARRSSYRRFLLLKTIQERNWCVAMRWQQLKKREEDENLLRLQPYECNCNTAARLKTVSA